MPVVCVMDGERALWRTLATHLTGAVYVLDLTLSGVEGFHMLERLWQAAHCFCPEGSDQAQAFVTHRLKRVLEGDVGRVVGGLRQMATKRGLRGAKLKQLNAAVGYLHNNRRFMRYDEYLAAGYPIGSGVAEGACRHLVKDRMERTRPGESVDDGGALPAADSVRTSRHVGREPDVNTPTLLPRWHKVPRLTTNSRATPRTSLRRG